MKMIILWVCIEANIFYKLWFCANLLLIFRDDSIWTYELLWVISKNVMKLKISNIKIKLFVFAKILPFRCSKIYHFYIIRIVYKIIIKKKDLTKIPCFRCFGGPWQPRFVPGCDRGRHGRLYRLLGFVPQDLELTLLPLHHHPAKLPKWYTTQKNPFIMALYILFIFSLFPSHFISFLQLLNLIVSKSCFNRSSCYIIFFNFAPNF